MPITATIAAISTPPGKGGVAVIRISGADALHICERIFLPKGSISPANAPRSQIYGFIIKDGARIDDVLCTYFPAPGSYTGEDIIEISCHGGILISRLVLEAALEAGAINATAGEFTRRAFINGKLSLSEADAIGMLLEASSESQVKLFSSDSRKKLSHSILEIRGDMTSLMSSIYARIDYPDEDLGEFTDDECIEKLQIIRDKLHKLALTYKTGKAIRDGIVTVICGKPNAGKSTLYNLLIGEDEAIVTSIPGTTRDFLEKRIALGKVIINLTDTAGIRADAQDPIEAIGISKSYKKLEDAELIFALFDASEAIDECAYDFIEKLKCSRAEVVAIITKSELAKEDSLLKATLEEHFDTVLQISAEKDPAGAIEIIENSVCTLFTDEKIEIGSDAIISSARENAALKRTLELLDSSISAAKAGLPQDIYSSDLELAAGALAEIDGRAVSEEVVADIFSKFCVGK